MFKFLHCADVHLDSPLKGLDRYEGAPAEEFRRSTREALANLVERAVAEEVAFVLIAGDLYDGDWRDHGTGLYLNLQMARLRDEGIPVYAIRGNHDAESQITRHLSLPENVTVLGAETPETVVIEGHGIALHGQGFATRAVTANLSEAYPARVPHLLNVGLLHTCATGSDGHANYAPCTVEGLRSKDYDYWALGHIHKRDLLHRDPPIVFPGNLQGRHARETGPKGATLVTVEDGRITKHEAIALDVVRWAVARVDLGGAIDLDDALGRVADGLDDAIAAADGRRLAVRFELVGACPAHDVLATKSDQAEAEIRKSASDRHRDRAWVEKVSLKTRPVRELDRESGPIAGLLKLIDELRSDPERLSALSAPEIADLKKKLPRPDPDGLDPDPFEVDTPEMLAEALEAVGSILLDGLSVREADV